MHDVCFNVQIVCKPKSVPIKVGSFETFERVHGCWTECAKQMSKSGRCEAHGTQVLVEGDDDEQAPLEEGRGGG